MHKSRESDRHVGRSRRRDCSPSVNEGHRSRVEMPKKEELTLKQKNQPFQVSTPRELWFVPDCMYLVDSRLSRDQNVIALETRYDVVTDPELSDEYHLVWPNYHNLSETRVKSFLPLKPCGMYLLVDCLKWTRPVDELEYATMNKNFNKLANDKTDKIAQLVNDYPEHFGVTDLKNLSFVIEIHHNDLLHAAAARKLLGRLYKYYEIYSDQKNLKWKFQNVDPNQKRPETKFYIDIHMNTNSYFMGIKILDWEHSYPCYRRTLRYGSPVAEIVQLMDVKPGVIVMDLDTGLAENIMEFSRNTKCHTIGLLENKRQMGTVLKNISFAESKEYIKAQYHNFILCDRFDSVPKFFNTAVLDRVVLRTTSDWDEYDIEEFLRRLETFLLTCSIGCIALITLPLDDDSHNAIRNVFHRSPYFDVIMSIPHFELTQQRRLYKVIRKNPMM